MIWEKAKRHILETPTPSRLHASDSSSVLIQGSDFKTVPLEQEPSEREPVPIETPSITLAQSTDVSKDELSGMYLPAGQGQVVN